MSDAHPPASAPTAAWPVFLPLSRTPNFSAHLAVFADAMRLVCLCSVRLHFHSGPFSFGLHPVQSTPWPPPWRMLASRWVGPIHFLWPCGVSPEPHVTCHSWSVSPPGVARRPAPGRLHPLSAGPLPGPHRAGARGGHGAGQHHRSHRGTHGILYR